MSCGWEGNRGSNVARTVRHRLERFIHVRDEGLSIRASSTPLTPLTGYMTLSIYYRHHAHGAGAPRADVINNE